MCDECNTNFEEIKTKYCHCVESEYDFCVADELNELHDNNVVRLIVCEFIVEQQKQKNKVQFRN
jgi:hypothetical protein